MDEGYATTNYTVSLSPSGVTPTADLTVNVRDGQRHGDGRNRLHGQVGDADVHEYGCGFADLHRADHGRTAIDEGTGETFTVTVSSPIRWWRGYSPRSLPHRIRSTTTITDDDDAPIRHHAEREPVNTLGEDDSGNFRRCQSHGGMGAHCPLTPWSPSARWGARRPRTPTTR